MKDIKGFEDLHEEDQKKIRDAFRSLNVTQTCKVLEKLFPGFTFHWSQTEEARRHRFEGQDTEKY